MHFRDGAALMRTVPDISRCFARALAMPNLNPPLCDVQQVRDYRQRLQAAIPQGTHFQPFIAFYLRDHTTPKDIEAAAQDILAVKFYPAGVTTFSSLGVTDIVHLYPVLEKMEKMDIVLAIHAEEADASIDVYDREKYFIERRLQPLIAHFPQLRVVVEHISTALAVDFVRDASPYIAATITAHHLLCDRNALFAGGLHPHYYCVPLLQNASHRNALLAAATSNNPKFFLGSDSAPHTQSNKESACGCAGCYTAYAAIELYAEAFASVNALHRLEDFASRHGAAFYGLPQNDATITLHAQTWRAPETIPFAEDVLVPWRAGEELHWRLSMT